MLLEQTAAVTGPRPGQEGEETPGLSRGYSPGDATSPAWVGTTVSPEVVVFRTFHLTVTYSTPRDTSEPLHPSEAESKAHFLSAGFQFLGS